MPKLRRYPGHDAPDLARAYNAGGLAVQVPADQAVEREIQFPYPVEGGCILRFRVSSIPTACSATA